MIHPTRFSALRVVRDFGFGVLMFVGVAGLIAAGQTSAYARPGAALAEAHTIISLQANAPAVGPLDQQPLLAANTSAFSPAMAPTGISPSHPLNILLLALMFGALTAMNLAIVRHMRAVYIRPQNH